MEAARQPGGCSQLCLSPSRRPLLPGSHLLSLVGCRTASRHRLAPVSPPPRYARSWPRQAVPPVPYPARQPQTCLHARCRPPRPRYAAAACAAAGPHLGRELLAEPLHVADHVRGGQAADAGVNEVGHLSEGGGPVGGRGKGASRERPAGNRLEKEAPRPRGRGCLKRPQRAVLPRSAGSCRTRARCCALAWSRPVLLRPSLNPLLGGVVSARTLEPPVPSSAAQLPPGGAPHRSKRALMGCFTLPPMSCPGRHLHPAAPSSPFLPRSRPPPLTASPPAWSSGCPRCTCARWRCRTCLAAQWGRERATARREGISGGDPGVGCVRAAPRRARAFLPHRQAATTQHPPPAPPSPDLSASWHLARFSSRRVSAWKFLRGMLGAFSMAISALVLQGLPTTSTLQLRSAASFSARPCGEGRSYALHWVFGGASRGEAAVPGAQLAWLVPTGLACDAEPRSCAAVP